MNKNKYTIKELRRLCQDTGPAKITQTILGRMARIFSIYLTRYLIRTNITPNQITFAGSVIYLFGVSLFAFGSYNLFIVGFLLLIVATITDASDGEVFRFRKYRQGYGGSYVEPLSHDIMYALIFMAIAYGAFLQFGNEFILIFGSIASIFKLLFRLTEIRFFYGVTKLLSAKGQIDTTKRFDKQSGIKRFIFIVYRQIATSTGLLIPLLLAILFNRLDLFVYFYGALFLALWAGLFARQMIRFRKISKQVIERHNYFAEIKQRMKNKKVVVFDLDGTLLDSMGIFADIASFLISWKHKIPRKEAKQMYIDTSGVPFFQQLEILFPGHTGNKEIADMFEEKKVHATEHLEMDAEEVDALKKLSKKRYKLAISSNNFQKNVDRFHRFIDLDFDQVLGYNDGFAKGKDHFDFILNKYNVTKDEIIFVGDSVSDMNKAREFDIDFIAKVGTFSDKDFEKENPNVITIRHLKELLDIL